MLSEAKHLRPPRLSCTEVKYYREDNAKRAMRRIKFTAEIETLIGDGDGVQGRIVTGVGTQIDAQDVHTRACTRSVGVAAVPSEEVVQTLGDRSESGYFATGEVEYFRSRLAAFGFEDDESHL